MEPKQSLARRRPIQILPEHLIDQIKAGEVIERPASLIKELLENSLDAQSTHIKIHLVDCGMELIQIEDDGIGMSYDELPFAFCRHATSKIERFEDIYNLHSYGFRGEALASLSSIARVTCVSHPKEDPTQGGRLIINGGETLSHTTQSAEKSGTSFYIKDLFYNTPARLKFIKSKTSEKNSLKRILNSFLLCSPQVSFTIRWDDEDKIFYPATSLENHASRMAQVLLKKDRPEELHFIDETYEDHRIRGYLSKISSRGAANKQQYFFANQRLFYDKSLHQLVMRSMEKVWGPGESGHYCIFIEAPPSQIDVNVHPHKTQVKFFKSSLVYSLLSGILKKLESTQRRPEELSRQLSSFSNTELIDTKEYQSMEIQSMLSGQEEDYSSPQVSFQPMSYENQSESKSALILEKSFCLHQYNGKYYIVSFKHFLADFLKRTLLRQAPLNENETTPLLISEPFKVSQGRLDHYLAELKNFGFEIDRLDPHTVVLRAIPRVLDSLNFRLIVGELCTYLGQSQSQNLTSSLEDFFDNGLPHCEITHHTLHFLTSSFNPDNKGVQEIDRHFLERIFS